ncbi:hypothetical protein NDU88_001958 [Pleurodeles waltl]|uniref:Uncharacterized protein n=1 Tax=Pleurodeles waltl TaxID=8319 RepID=A0AAV7TJT7_PLEWA|nr:hypothetical protein NDU88_001958 [Pleurodeles waltl]
MTKSKLLRQLDKNKMATASSRADDQEGGRETKEQNARDAWRLNRAARESLWSDQAPSRIGGWRTPERRDLGPRLGEEEGTGTYRPGRRDRGGG